MTSFLYPRIIIAEQPRSSRSPILSEAAVQLRLATSPDCPRCGQPVLLSARIPNGWQNSSGRQVQGTTEVALCPGCDTDDQHAAPLIRFLQTHPQIPEDRAEELAALLGAWATHLRPSRVDLAQLEREIEEWRRGEL
jgi:hypothetical protein